MPNLREMIKKLLFPYKNILSIAVISDEEQNCTLLKKLLCSVFDSADTTLNEIGNISYKHDKEVFSFILNNETEIKFSIHEKVSDFKVIESSLHNHDILIPLLRINRYATHEYDQTAHTTDAISSSIVSSNKPAIFSYLNAEYLFEDKIENETQWQVMNNELHKRIIDNTVESEIKLTEQGNAVIQGLFKVFNYHSKEQRLFGIPQKVNFFASDNSASEIAYGKNEFATNLLMRLLSFDKLNSYHFQIN